MQDEIKAAVAAHEEYIKRQRPCQGVIGVAHRYRPFGRPSGDGTIKDAATWSACIVCGVTETVWDFARRS